MIVKAPIKVVTLVYVGVDYLLIYRNSKVFHVEVNNHNVTMIITQNGHNDIQVFFFKF